MTTISLHLGSVSACVDPVGARLESVHLDEILIVDGYQAADARQEYRGVVLAPWPNRLADGEWSWKGRSYRSQINDPATRSALHGLVADAEFSVLERDDSRACLHYLLRASEAYPFAIALTVQYSLAVDGLSCQLNARNVSDDEAPIGLGMHPYLAASDLVDDLVLQIPAQTSPLLDWQWQEVGRERSHGELDFRQARRIGATALDHSWTDLDRDAEGWSTINLLRPDGLAVEVRMGPTTRWATVYSADTLDEPRRRRSLAIEPQTCGANALRSGTDLTVLGPGESLALDWEVIVTRRAAADVS